MANTTNLNICVDEVLTRFFRYAHLKLEAYYKDEETVEQEDLEANEFAGSKSPVWVKSMYVPNDKVKAIIREEVL